MNTIEQRLATLEQCVSTLQDAGMSDWRGRLLDDAKVMAIYSIAQELAVKAGVDLDSFRGHYAIRFRWWHDYYLRRVEDSSPALAAELDPRSVAQAGVDPTYPSIFDPLPPDTNDA